MTLAKAALQTAPAFEGCAGGEGFRMRGREANEEASK